MDQLNLLSHGTKNILKLKIGAFFIPQKVMTDTKKSLSSESKIYEFPNKRELFIHKNIQSLKRGEKLR